MSVKVIFITSNKHKINEINQILKIPNCMVTDYFSEYKKMIEYEENTWTFEGNAIKKIEMVKPNKNIIYMSEDSGLCVDALNGAPGIFSARYCGESATGNEQCSSIISELKGIRNRSAKFVCALAIKTQTGEVVTFRGEVFGTISAEIKGEKGFGYDPIFIPNSYTNTMAEIDDKHTISHRANALAQFKAWYLKQKL